MLFFKYGYKHQKTNKIYAPQTKVNWRHKVPFLSILNGRLIDLAAPVNLNVWWNFGSMLGLVLGVQIISGLFITMHYCCDTSLSFDSISHIMRDVYAGWFFRYIHANGASFFIMALYIHVGRSIYYGSFKLWSTFGIGILLALLVIATAFLGYVLPWGQISFWGATVITNLVSAIPLVGSDIVVWLWGGFSVDNATLTRFFTFHFLLPFIIRALTIIHIFFLHQQGSNNPLGLNCSPDKVAFHWYYSIKDVSGFVFLITVFLFVIFFAPTLFFEADNFIPANPLVTPSHILPEWYFLFAYAILRCIPTKLPGTGMLFSRILLLGFLRKNHNRSMKGLTYYGPLKFIFWSHISCFFFLTLAGAWPVSSPFVGTTQVLSLIYVSYFVHIDLLRGWWEDLIF